jgi:hypothetical protein
MVKLEASTGLVCVKDVEVTPLMGGFPVAVHRSACAILRQGLQHRWLILPQSAGVASVATVARVERDATHGRGCGIGLSSLASGLHRRFGAQGRWVHSMCGAAVVR